MGIAVSPQIHPQVAEFIEDRSHVDPFSYNLPLDREQASDFRFLDHAALEGCDQGVSLFGNLVLNLENLLPLLALFLFQNDKLLLEVVLFVQRGRQAGLATDGVAGNECGRQFANCRSK